MVFDKPVDGALHMIDKGVSVFPLREVCGDDKEAKKPAVAWKEWATLDKNKVKSYAKEHPYCGWGSALSNGFTGIDDDGPNGEGVVGLEIKYGQMPKTFRVSTWSGKVHLYYKGVTNRNTVKDQNGLNGYTDTRSTIGGYLVCPGTKIYGKNFNDVTAEYTILDDLPFAELPKAIQKDIDGGKVVEKVKTDIDEEDLDQEWHKGDVINYLENRARAAVSGSGDGDATGYAVAAHCGDLGVSQGVCEELMVRHYLPRCTGADDAWITKVVSNAYRYRQNGVGAKTAEADFKEIWEDAERVVAENIDELQPLGVLDLCTTYPDLRPPLIHGLLREGETMNIVASPKVGKSWLVGGLAADMAVGQEWLGLRTERKRVLVIDNELHPETTSSRFRAILEAKGLLGHPDINKNLRMVHLRGKEMDLYKLAKYLERINPGDYGVVILDAWYRFIPKGESENDNAFTTKALNLIDNHAKRLGCAFILIHHASKGDQGGKSVTDVGAGAGAFSRATDAHVVLRPHATQDDLLCVDMRQRSWKPMEPFCIRREHPIFNVDDCAVVELATALTQKTKEADERLRHMLGEVQEWFTWEASMPSVELQERIRSKFGVGEKKGREVLKKMREDLGFQLIKNEGGKYEIRVPE